MCQLIKLIGSYTERHCLQRSRNRVIDAQHRASIAFIGRLMTAHGLSRLVEIRPLCGVVDNR